MDGILFLSFGFTNFRIKNKSSNFVRIILPESERAGRIPPGSVRAEKDSSPKEIPETDHGKY